VSASDAPGDAALRRWVWGDSLDAGRLPDDAVTWLRALGGPACIDIAGIDPTRARVVTTLLHGNEPSGLEAMLRYLAARPRPATNVRLLIASVATALVPPVFSNRHLPDRRDLNRCFGEGDLRAPGDRDARLARALYDAIVEVGPEAVVDLHNNTGHNPAYGVAVRCGAEEQALVGLFADRVLHAPLALGTVVEALVDGVPAVTIECGRSGDPVATDAAHAGLVRFLDHAAPTKAAPPVPLRVLVAPTRVCIDAAVELAFGDAPVPGPILTVSADVDRHNFERLPEGSLLGWVGEGVAWPFEAWAPDGREISRDLFAIREGRLVTRRAFTPIMMTTRPDIAKSDCLFYAADDGDG